MEEVTIAIPIYKPNIGFLSALFLSIRDQQFINFNVVISDDGNDEDLIWSAAPEEIHHKIKYCKNAGPSGIFGNLNNAIKQATGSYIQIFCQDDVMLPSLISNNYECLSKHPDAGMIFTSFNFLMPDGNFKIFDRKDIQFIPTVLEPIEANNYFLYFGCMPGNLSSVMLKRSLLDQVGYFDESYKFAGDYEFWVRAAQKTKIIFSKQCPLNIRDHSLRSSRVLGMFNRLNEIKHIHKFLIEHNTIPVSNRVVVRYAHFHVLRSALSFSIRRLFLLKKSEWKILRELFDGKPYSLKTAIGVFLYPITPGIKKIIARMEIPRD